jgi:hypothetical protein
MKEFFSKIGWFILSIFCLGVVNLALLVFVVVLDVVAGRAPQFSLPLFASLFIILAGLSLWRISRHKRFEFDHEDNSFSKDRNTPRGLRRISSANSAILHSAIIIKRKPVVGSASREGNDYEVAA